MINKNENSSTIKILPGLEEFSIVLVLEYLLSFLLVFTYNFFSKNPIPDYLTILFTTVYMVFVISIIVNKFDISIDFNLKNFKKSLKKTILYFLIYFSIVLLIFGFSVAIVYALHYFGDLNIEEFANNNIAN